MSLTSLAPPSMTPTSVAPPTSPSTAPSVLASPLLLVPAKLEGLVLQSLTSAANKTNSCSQTLVYAIHSLTALKPGFVETVGGCCCRLARSVKNVKENGSLWTLDQGVTTTVHVEKSYLRRESKPD